MKKLLVIAALALALTGCYLKPVGYVVDSYCGAVSQEQREKIRESINDESWDGIIKVECKND